MKSIKLQSLCFLASLLLPQTSRANAQNLRASLSIPHDIDYDSIPGCFEGIFIPSHEPPPESWCKLNLSFRVFLRCMDKNINLRLVEPGFLRPPSENDFVMECLHLCYIDGAVEKEPLNTLQNTFFDRLT